MSYVNKPNMKKKKSKISPERLYAFLEEKGIEFSASLKKNATEWEKIVYKKLINLNVSFIFQHPVIVKNGKSYSLFILDFLIPECNLVVEIDSIKHHTSKEDVKKDNKKTRLLNKAGYHVIRLQNNQITHFSESEFNILIKDTIKLLTKVN